MAKNIERKDLNVSHANQFVIVIRGGLVESVYWQDDIQEPTPDIIVYDKDCEAVSDDPDEKFSHPDIELAGVFVLYVNDNIERASRNFWELYDSCNFEKDDVRIDFCPNMDFVPDKKELESMLANRDKRLRQ